FDEHLERAGAGNIWVAQDDSGQLVGMAGLVSGENSAELEPLVVASGHRSRGIGRKLAEAVIARAHRSGARTVEGRPAARNAQAIRFFHGIGLDVLGQLELLLDLVEREPELWREGERLADRTFRV